MSIMSTYCTLWFHVITKTDFILDDHKKTVLKIYHFQPVNGQVLLLLIIHFMFMKCLHSQFSLKWPFFRNLGLWLRNHWLNGKRNKCLAGTCLYALCSRTQNTACIVWPAAGCNSALSPVQGLLPRSDRKKIHQTVGTGLWLRWDDGAH